MVLQNCDGNTQRSRVTATGQELKLTRKEAIAAAEEEGLTLPRSNIDNHTTGFIGVQPKNGKFRLRIQKSEPEVSVSGFTSAEGAALFHARHVAKEVASNAAASHPVSPHNLLTPPLTPG